MSDTVNVAARVEQLTKTTGDTMLLTQKALTRCVSTGRTRRPGIPCPERKSAAMQVFGLDQDTESRVDLTS
jgi:adenylate cyclase